MNKDLEVKLSLFIDRVDRLLPPTPAPIDWSLSPAALWRHHNFGGYLQAVSLRDEITFRDLVGVGRQAEELLNNTRAFLMGRPANNVLLRGSRGSGKSSMIRALVNELSVEGLHLVQVDRNDLISLPILCDILGDSQGRFVIYFDDLSFEQGDNAYKVLKSVLDGALSGVPENVIFYATSNRRHLLPENAVDNNGVEVVNGELHMGDAIEEKTSLADRFGLWLSFYAFSQEKYLEACEHWVEFLGGGMNAPEDFKHAALRFSTERGVRSGRSAWQFACKWVGAEQVRLSLY